MSKTPKSWTFCLLIPKSKTNKQKKIALSRKPTASSFCFPWWASGVWILLSMMMKPGTIKDYIQSCVINGKLKCKSVLSPLELNKRPSNQRVLKRYAASARDKMQAWKWIWIWKWNRVKGSAGHACVRISIFKDVSEIQSFIEVRAIDPPLTASAFHSSSNNASKADAKVFWDTFCLFVRDVRRHLTGLSCTVLSNLRVWTVSSSFIHWIWVIRMNLFMLTDVSERSAQTTCFNSVVRPFRCSLFLILSVFFCSCRHGCLLVTFLISHIEWLRVRRHEAMTSFHLIWSYCNYNMQSGLMTDVLISIYYSENGERNHLFFSSYLFRVLIQLVYSFCIG